MHFLAVFFSCARSMTAADWPQFRVRTARAFRIRRACRSRIGPSSNVIWANCAAARSLVAGADENAHFRDGGGARSDRDHLPGSRKGQDSVEARSSAVRAKNTCRTPTRRPRHRPRRTGSNVYVFFGDFGMISYSQDGEERWRLPMGPFNNANGHGSSPIVAGKSGGVDLRSGHQFVFGRGGQGQRQSEVGDAAAGFDARLCNARGISTRRTERPN
jgi:hypothetical protein